MTWFKVDDSFHSHPKVLAAEPAALGLWVVAGAWCSANLTDGFVPDYVLPRLLPDAARLAEELATCRLWKRTKGGYRFHDWNEFQPTKEEITAERKRWAEKKANQRAARRNAASYPRSTTNMSPGDTMGDSLVESNGESPGESWRPDPTRPDPSFPKGKEERQPSVVVPRKRGTRIPDDFAVTADMVTWAQQRVPGVDGKTETEKFVNFWRAKTGKDATKLDWPATWRNWMLNAPQRRQVVALPSRTNGTDIDWDAAMARAQDRETRGAAAS
jgi:hypothetical protein